AQLHARAGEVGDRRDLVEEFAQTFVLEPVERRDLHGDQVRNIQQWSNLRVRLLAGWKQRSATDDVCRDSHSARAPSNALRTVISRTTEKVPLGDMQWVPKARGFCLA